MGATERQLRCRCGEVLWARRAGEWTLRAAILKLDDDGQVRARCPAPHCHEDLDVPFLRGEPMPAGDPPQRRGRRLVVRARALTG